jgi:hypothetical protein
VFWLLLTFNRAVRVMKNAGDSSVGHVADAVGFNLWLARDMTMLKVVAKTKSLGCKTAEGDDDWRWRDDSGDSVLLHFEKGRLVRWRLERAGDLESAPR